MSIDANSFNNQHALNYLQKAMKNPEIDGLYGKYFGYADFKAQVLNYKRNHFDYDILTAEQKEEIKKFKVDLAIQICEKYLGKIDQQNEILAQHERDNQFYTLKALAVKIVVLDMETEVLHLITRNQRKGGPRHDLIQHSYLQVKISNEPHISNWSRVNTTLSTPKKEAQGYLIANRVINNNKFSIVSGEFNSKKADGASINIKICFLWKNHRREIYSENRSFYKNAGWNPDSVGNEQKYLYVDFGGSVKFIKSHGDETPPLLSDEECAKRTLPFNNQTPISPEWLIIPHENIVDIFQPILKIKSAAFTSDYDHFLSKETY